MRYLMIVTYDGKNYSGFQKQKSTNKTIQFELEKAIETITKQQVECVASGRTDAGVSAYNQPVHFDIDIKINEQKFLKSINALLPDEIKVLKIEPTTIHARFSAKRKTYIYKMHISNIDLPLEKDKLIVKSTLNFKAMKKFCSLITGTHDFGGFKAAGGQTENDVRTIFSAKLIHKDNDLTFVVTGNGFLYKMVRNLVGTMLKIGEGKIDLKQIKPTLFNGFKSTFTAKPEYLYLFNVKYN